MRLWGILLLLIASAGTGYYAAGRLRRNVHSLELLCAWTEDAAACIRYSHMETAELLSFLSVHPSYREFRFMQSILSEMSPQIPPQTLWQKALRQDAAVPGCAESALTGLGTSLGTTDCEGQLAALALCGTQLRQAAQNARETVQTKGRLYRALGLLGGAMAGILLW